MECETCRSLGLTCLRCQASPWADRTDTLGRDIYWSATGPRCAFCARAMVRWGLGWVCGGCGNGIDKEGQAFS